MNVCKISIDLQRTLASLTYDSVTLTLVYNANKGKYRCMPIVPTCVPPGHAWRDQFLTMELPKTFELCRMRTWCKHPVAWGEIFDYEGKINRPQRGKCYSDGGKIIGPGFGGKGPVSGPSLYSRLIPVMGLG